MEKPELWLYRPLLYYGLGTCYGWSKCPEAHSIRISQPELCCPAQELQPHVGFWTFEMRLAWTEMCYKYKTHIVFFWRLKRIPRTSLVVCACMLSRALRPHQALLSMGFPRQEYWSGLPFPPPGDLPDPGIETMSPTSIALAGRFFMTSHLGSPPWWCSG